MILGLVRWIVTYRDRRETERLVREFHEAIRDVDRALARVVYHDDGTWSENREP